MPDVSFKDLCIDVTAGDGRPAAVDDEIRWWVMADPEGNEFCAFE